MSSPLAIGAVSAVMRNLLDNGMINVGAALGAVKVTAVAPDTIDLDDENDPPRLNVFLHQVTPNQGWRQAGLPSRSSSSGERLTNAPLALDLHYMVTAYGRADFQAEILLGYAMHLLHERPVLDRAAIRKALDPSPLPAGLMPPAFQALTASDLADQVELIKITPAMMSADDMSKLWSAIQSHYRPSSTYLVSVVLIEGTRPTVSPLPVLSRGKVDPATGRDRGVAVTPDLLSPLPTLSAAVPPADQTAARLGETVTLDGRRLAGAGHRVLLHHRLFTAPLEVVPASVDATAGRITFVLANNGAAQAELAAGQLSISVSFVPVGEVNRRETNAVPLQLAPAPVIAADAPLSLPAAGAVRGGNPALVTVTMHSRPQVRLAQRASLLLDTVEAVAAPRGAPADPLVFQFPATAVPAGNRRLRLRVDGIDSVLIDRTGDAPVFDATQELAVP